MKKYRPFLFFSVVAVMTLVGTILQVFGQERVQQEGVPKETKPFIISRLVIATAVENREPVGVAETFPASAEKIFCFLEAVNIVKDMEVSLTWFHGQKELLKFNLPLHAGPRWRTYAFKNLRGLKGDWRAEIRDAGGNLLKDVKFKVE